MFELTFNVSGDDLHGIAYVASQVAEAAKGLRELLGDDLGTAEDVLLAFIERGSQAISDAAERAARAQAQQD